MCILFIFQAFYAATKRAKIAIQFDIGMAIGCSVPLAIWFDQHWLVQILISVMLFSNFFMAYKLRDLQNMGTSWIFVIVYVSLLVVFTGLNFGAAVG